MGRKAKPDLGRFQVKLPTELVERLDSQAGVEERSRSDLLADGAELYLRRASTKSPKKRKRRAAAE